MLHNAANSFFFTFDAFDLAIKVREIFGILPLPIYLILDLRFELGFECADFSFVLQDGVIRQFEKTVQEVHPVGHLHQNATLGTVFREIKVGGHDTV